MPKFAHYAHLSPERNQELEKVSVAEVFVKGGENKVPLRMLNDRFLNVGVTDELLDYWHRSGVFIPGPDEVVIDSGFESCKTPGLFYLRASKGVGFTWSYIFAKVSEIELREFLKEGCN